MEEIKSKPRLHLFDAYGIELEYMIVDIDSIDVKPITDQLLYKIAGDYLTEVNMGKISYSNELALHVVELKTTDPEPELEGLDQQFHEHICAINELLRPFHAKLLPTGAHPWMDPYKEMKLWPHEHNPIYESYHRIFDCRGHGWANLQSMHINLPFGNDDEFFLLHSAIRLILPILPALSASSPIMDGKVTNICDTRLDVYRRNQQRFPIITGQVIPPVTHSEAHYQETILEPIYKEIAPHDPENILQYEWLNSKGAIARFDRSAIEIRILDIQESPKADIAIARAVSYLLKALIREDISSRTSWMMFPQEVLVPLYAKVVKDGEKAIIDNVEYLQIFNLSTPIAAGLLWSHLLRQYLEKEPSDALEVILREGTLSSRIVEAHKRYPGKDGLRHIYNELSDCLQQNKMFSLSRGDNVWL